MRKQGNGWDDAPQEARDLFEAAVGYPLTDATEVEGWTAGDVLALLRDKAVEVDEEVSALEAAVDRGVLLVSGLDKDHLEDIDSGHWSATSDVREPIGKALARGRRFVEAYDNAIRAWDDYSRGVENE